MSIFSANSMLLAAGFTFVPPVSHLFRLHILPRQASLLEIVQTIVKIMVYNDQIQRIQIALLIPPQVSLTL